MEALGKRRWDLPEEDIRARVAVEFEGRNFELNSGCMEKVIGKSEIANEKFDLNGNFSLELTGKGVLVQDLTKKLNCRIIKDSEKIFKGLKIEKNNIIFTFDYQGEDIVVKYLGKTTKIREGLSIEELRFEKQDNREEALPNSQRTPFWVVYGEFYRYIHSERTLNNTLSPKLLITFKSLEKGQVLEFNERVFKLKLIRS